MFDNHTKSLLQRYGRSFILRSTVDTPDPSDPTSSTSVNTDINVLGYTSHFKQNERDGTLIREDSIRFVLGPEDTGGNLVNPTINHKILDSGDVYNITYVRPIYVGTRVETWLLAIHR